MDIMKHDTTEKTREVRDHKNRDKVEEAKERKRARTKINNQAQIKILDDRLGVGIGAVKERGRLTKSHY